MVSFYKQSKETSAQSFIYLLIILGLWDQDFTGGSNVKDTYYFYKADFPEYKNTTIYLPFKLFYEDNDKYLVIARNRTKHLALQRKRFTHI